MVIMFVYYIVFLTPKSQFLLEKHYENDNQNCHLYLWIRAKQMGFLIGLALQPKSTRWRHGIAKTWFSFLPLIGCNRLFCFTYSCNINMQLAIVTSALVAVVLWTCIQSTVAIHGTLRETKWIFLNYELFILILWHILCVYFQKFDGLRKTSSKTWSTSDVEQFKIFYS